MSIIAWDGTTIATDCQCVTAGMRARISKIQKLEDGTILAWTGTHEQGLVLARWYKEGKNRNEWPVFQSTKHWTRLVAVLPAGEILEYEQQPEPQSVVGDYRAWGSGRDFAMGAMAMGADAKRAVEIASIFSVECGLGVEFYDIAAMNDEMIMNNGSLVEKTKLLQFISDIMYGTATESKARVQEIREFRIAHGIPLNI